MQLENISDKFFLGEISKDVGGMDGNHSPERRLFSALLGEDMREDPDEYVGLVSKQSWKEQVDEKKLEKLAERVEKPYQIYAVMTVMINMGQNGEALRLSMRLGDFSFSTPFVIEGYYLKMVNLLLMDRHEQVEIPLELTRQPASSSSCINLLNILVELANGNYDNALVLKESWLHTGIDPALVDKLFLGIFNLNHIDISEDVCLDAEKKFDQAAEAMMASSFKYNF